MMAWLANRNCIGIYPFSAECKEQDLSSLADLDGSKTKFIFVTRKAVDDHSKDNFSYLVACPFSGDGAIVAATGDLVRVVTNLFCVWQRNTGRRSDKAMITKTTFTI